MIIFIIIALPLILSTKSLALIKWRDKEGRDQKFCLRDKVSSKWWDLGILLTIEQALLDGWDSQYLKNASRCWDKVMDTWITSRGTGDYPSTWEGVYQLLEDINCGKFVDALREAVTHAII